MKKTPARQTKAAKNPANMPPKRQPEKHVPEKKESKDECQIFPTLREGLQFTVDQLAAARRNFIVMAGRIPSPKDPKLTRHLFQIVSENMVYGTDSTGLTFHLTFGGDQELLGRFKALPMCSLFDYNPLGDVPCYDLCCERDVERATCIALQLGRELFQRGDLDALGAEVSDSGPIEAQ